VAPSVPVTPVDRGRPVAAVSTAADGVPRFGVVMAQFVTRQKFPLPEVFPDASAEVTAEVLNTPAELLCTTPAVDHAETAGAEENV